MAFKYEPRKFNTEVSTLVIGSGSNTVSVGGENAFAFYTFDSTDGHRPKVGVVISDTGRFTDIPGIKAFYEGSETLAGRAKAAAAMPGADFIVICLDSAHPDSKNSSPEECAVLVKEIADTVDFPLIIEGCGNIEKDSKVFEKVAEALQGKNVLILSAHEENYKGIAAVGLAYSQCISAESAVDINLAKQLNVLISQVGVKPDKMAMNLGSAAAGYGFEYIASTIERVKTAALAQSDAMLQMPVITPVYSETWTVKESIASEEDYPEWGPAEQRGIHMEISTAAACLAAGSNAVILCHPESVAAISALISALI